MAKENKHLKAFREKHMKPSETVVADADGYIGEMMGKGDSEQHNGALIVTNERVVFYRKGFLGEVLETMELKKVTSIERRSRLGHRSIRIHTSHDDLEFKSFDKEAEQSVVDAIEDGRSESAAPASQPSPAADNDDPLKALEKLAELKEKGILSEEEFQEKKASLLEKV